MNVVLYVAELDIRGGTHKQVLRLAQCLLRQGHAVTVATPVYEPSKTYEEFADVPVITLRSSALRPGSLAERVWSKLAPFRLAARLGDVDVLNVHDNRGVLFYAAARLLGKAPRAVWQINDLHPAFQVGAHGGRSRRSVKQAIHVTANRWMARQVDAITVNVGKNASRVQTCLGHPATVFHCGVDLPAVPSEPRAPTEPPYRILSIGVFFPYRNYERLVEACRQAQQRLGQPVELTIVGDTRYAQDYADAVVAAASASGIALRLCQGLTQQELDGEMAQAHVFAFVNIDQSWGLSVFEAAARSKPVLLSSSVGASELLAGKPGFECVDPEDVADMTGALTRLLGDPAACLDAARAARTTVQSMSWDAMYGTPMTSLFRRLTGGAPAPQPR